MASIDGRPEHRPDYRPDIDGLRALAVTAVVAFHVGGDHLLRSGFVGVDIFFVISGFLIGGILYRATEAREFSYARFYARRARRILPALILVILTTLLLGMALMTPIELKALGLGSVRAILGVSNIEYARGAIGYFGIASNHDPMLMTWSLGVEEQYYLLAPLAMIALVRFAPRHVFAGLVAITLVSAAASVAMTETVPTAAFYLLPSRAWELGVGMLLAVAQAQGRVRPQKRMAELLAAGGLVVMLLSMVLLPLGWFFPGPTAALPVLGAAAAIAGGGSVTSRRLLGSKPAVWIGRVSYSWYLWHWPLLALLRTATIGITAGWALLAVAPVSLGIAFVSWRFVEQPFRRVRLPERRVLPAYAAAIAATVAVAGGLWFAQGLPGRVSTQLASLDVEVGWRPCMADLGQMTIDDSPPCRRAGSGRKTIAVIGDSHADALGDGIAALAEQRGWGYRIISKAACPPTIGIALQRTDMPGLNRECVAFNRMVFDRIAADPAIGTVMLVWRWHLVREGAPPGLADGNGRRGALQGDMLESSLRRSIEALHAAGKRVLIAQDTPLWMAWPHDVLALRDLPLRRLLFRASRRVAEGPVKPEEPAVATRVARVAAEQGVTVIPLRSAICTPRCTMWQGETPLYRDGGHLTRTGAILVLTPFADEIFAGGG